MTEAACRRPGPREDRRQAPSRPRQRQWRQPASRRGQERARHLRAWLAEGHAGLCDGGTLQEVSGSPSRAGQSTQAMRPIAIRGA